MDDDEYLSDYELDNESLIDIISKQRVNKLTKIEYGINIILL